MQLRVTSWCGVRDKNNIITGQIYKKIVLLASYKDKNMNKFVGREDEINTLKAVLTSNNPELLAVYGRRRVGKTFLVRHVYGSHILFEISGLHNGKLPDQLENFSNILSRVLQTKDIKRPGSWLEAFRQLESFLEKTRSKKKKVIFFDEFPWFDTPRSKFLMAFENFWNSYVANRPDLVVVICGSAASYVVRNIIKSKGGLHNRITQKVRLLPFTLQEAEQFCRSRNLRFTRYDILQLYMIIGGVPFYLEKLQKSESVSQAIDRLCFTKDGILADEFNIVYASLFKYHGRHVSIVKALTGTRKGITRDELSKRSGIKTGGTLSATLDELIESGFVSRYLPFGKKSKDSLYRLTDEYSLFYIKYIDNNKAGGKGAWNKLSQSRSYESWSGFSFETTCLKHVNQIKSALGISAIYSENSSWTYKSADGGVQIDLLIDRSDNVINLCEMKFSRDQFVISRSYANELRKKENVFRAVTNSRKSIFITMITTYGVKENSYKLELVEQELNIDTLFA